MFNEDIEEHDLVDVGRASRSKYLPPLDWNRAFICRAEAPDPVLREGSGSRFRRRSVRRHPWRADRYDAR